YYANDLLESVTDNSGGFVRNYYDKNGSILKTEKLRDSEEFDIERFQYDEMNRLVKRIQLVDRASIYGEADVSKLADPEHPEKIQLITGYEYDILGNQTKEIAPRAYEYHESDIENRAEYTLAFEYDELNRVTKAMRKVSGKDVAKTYGYDAAGNRVWETNELGYQTSFTYNNVNQLTSVTNPKGNTMTYAYDLAGNKISEVNAKNYKMQYEYDQLNRLVIIRDPYDKVITKNIFDGNGNLIKQIDAKGYLSASSDAQRYGTTYQYDLANRLTKIVDPEIGALN
ncbi:hypothetical protein, partial [Stenotrophomonas maltophilia group sp. RNC7]|uniref:RHS repeat domain-containing protein n=1 Tax=Stenotrophomonas maltophilia group sp. RNC7 TaxID=3071467 RepID=UPI0027E07A58